MGREIRNVPKNWVHPKDENGDYIPLYGGSFTEILKEWKKENAMWKKGMCKDYIDDYSDRHNWVPIEEEERNMSFSEYHGSKPKKEDYMPEWNKEEKTHLQMYEKVTHGTPLSPVMATPEVLAHWLVDNEGTDTYEGWLHICKGNRVTSLVMRKRSFDSGATIKKK